VKPSTRPQLYRKGADYASYSGTTRGGRGELRRFATGLNLSEDQKQKLHGFLTEASEKLQEYKQQNPGATKEDLIKKVAGNRTTIRQRPLSFLTPEQLTKWDAEATKAKEFLGQKLAGLTRTELRTN
jgi:Spy/CpxP family protein refolding chaperone